MHINKHYLISFHQVEASVSYMYVWYLRVFGCVGVYVCVCALHFRLAISLNAFEIEVILTYRIQKRLNRQKKNASTKHTLTHTTHNHIINVFDECQIG